MTNPFAHVQRAVGFGRPEPAFTPYVSAVANFRTGIGYVARFPGTAYARELISANLTSTVICPVSIYLGEVVNVGMRLSTYGDGSKTSYNPPRPDHVPPNVPVLIVWETTKTGGTANVTAQFRQAS